MLAPPSPPVPALTIVTSMFLHGSILHIGFNMLFLFVFGPAVEHLCGHVRFLAFYLLCGIAGGIAQIAIGPGSHVPAIGASGAIAGVLGAYLVNFPFATINTIVPIGCFPLFLRLPALLVIGLWAGNAVRQRLRDDQRPRGGVARRDRVFRPHRRILRGGHSHGAPPQAGVKHSGFDLATT